MKKKVTIKASKKLSKQERESLSALYTAKAGSKIEDEEEKMAHSLIKVYSSTEKCYPILLVMAELLHLKLVNTREVAKWIMEDLS